MNPAQCLRTRFVSAVDFLTPCYCHCSSVSAPQSNSSSRTWQNSSCPPPFSKRLSKRSFSRVGGGGGGGGGAGIESGRRSRRQQQQQEQQEVDLLFPLVINSARASKASSSLVTTSTSTSTSISISISHDDIAAEFPDVGSDSAASEASTSGFTSLLNGADEVNSGAVHGRGGLGSGGLAATVACSSSLLLLPFLLSSPEEALAVVVAGQPEPFPSVMTFAGPEPSNALSLPTWVIHVASVAEWVTAMALVWKYSETKGNNAWKGLAWGMVPLLAGAMCACTWHFFYNAESLEVLVALQAFLTVVGNCTMWAAAYRIWKSSPESAKG